jgi:hypothetical protein
MMEHDRGESMASNGSHRRELRRILIAFLIVLVVGSGASWYRHWSKRVAEITDTPSFIGAASSVPWHVFNRQVFDLNNVRQCLGLNNPAFAAARNGLIDAQRAEKFNELVLAWAKNNKFDEMSDLERELLASARMDADAQGYEWVKVNDRVALATAVNQCTAALSADLAK